VVLASCAGGSEAIPSAPAQGASPEVSPQSEPNPPTARPTSASPPPIGAEREFSTDFSIHTVDYSEILSGGPPKDGIPAIDEPRFETIEQAGAWLGDLEPVILYQQGGDARAYPLQILVWHEIVNDVVAGRPVLITFCPLCNTAIAFERTVGGRVLDFGTTGRLRFSNLIMYDRQTETWWQQATGEAIAGELTGTQLEFVPAPIIAWEEFRSSYPQGKVLSRDTGHVRRYGENPYVGYDSINNSPFLYYGPLTPDRMPPMARVLTLDLNGDVVAFPYETLETVQVANEIVGGEPIVVLWAPGTASALDSGALAFGRDVGTALAYSRELEGTTLSFRFDGAGFLDEQTGSRWDLLGQASEGELAGAKLTQVVSVNHFWFSWVAFQPDTRVYQP
jgi:hypothetical protein